MVLTYLVAFIAVILGGIAIAYFSIEVSILTISKLNGCKFKDVSFYQWQFPFVLIVLLIGILCVVVFPIALDFVSKFI